MAPELSPILQAAKEILKEAGRKGLHVRTIAEAAVAKNKNLGLSIDDFCKRLQSALSGNLKLKSIKPTFASVNWDKGSRKGKSKQGWYRLRPERVIPVIETVPAPQPGKAFLGKAGEYAVMSELLFWEFNASIMTVDDGIDIVASKNNKFFYIQVKAATRQDNGKYIFTINKDSFKRYNTANVFYVFVLRENIQNDYIIIPSMQINYFIGTGAITDGSVFSLTITTNDKKTEYTLNNKVKITPCYGNFGELIK